MIRSEIQKMYELMNNVCVNFFLAWEILLKIIRSYVEKVSNVVILRLHLCLFISFIFNFQLKKTKFTHTVVVSIDVWQSYLSHSSSSMNPINLFRCFVANSLLSQFTHFFG